MGYWADANSIQYGFPFDSGSRTTLPVSTFTNGDGINDSGQIVGYYDDASGRHGFLLDHGSHTTLDVPGSIGAFANGINAINASGQIVGFYFDAGGKAHGFLATPVP